MHVIVSADNKLNCTFYNIDICGYKDLSESGINWAQVYSDGESTPFRTLCATVSREDGDRHQIMRLETLAK